MAGCPNAINGKTTELEPQMLTFESGTAPGIRLFQGSKNRRACAQCHRCDESAGLLYFETEVSSRLKAFEVTIHVLALTSSNTPIEIAKDSEIRVSHK